MSESLKAKAEKLEKFKYPLVVLIIGVVLMLLPSGSSQNKDSPGGEEQMAQLKEDLAVQKAIDFLVAEAKFVD